MLRVTLVVALIVFSTLCMGGVPDLAYLNTTITVETGDRNSCVPSALVYGYCPKYGLLWPRFSHDQYTNLWANPPEACCGRAGLLKALIPKERWDFAAVGVLAAQAGEGVDLVCARTPLGGVVPEAEGNVVLSTTRRDRLVLGQEIGMATLNVVLSRQKPLELWLQTPLANPTGFPVNVSYRDTCELVLLVEDERHDFHVKETEAATEESAKLRPTVKGIKKLRMRLGLSQVQFGKLVGVSGQSVVLWENSDRGRLRMRATTLAALAGILKIGKREARKRLEQLGEPKPARKPRRRE